MDPIKNGDVIPACYVIFYQAFHFFGGNWIPGLLEFWWISIGFIGSIPEGSFVGFFAPQKQFFHFSARTSGCLEHQKL